MQWYNINGGERIGGVSAFCLSILSSLANNPSIFLDPWLKDQSFQNYDSFGTFFIWCFESLVVRCSANAYPQFQLHRRKDRNNNNHQSLATRSSKNGLKRLCTEAIFLYDSSTSQSMHNSFSFIPSDFWVYLIHTEGFKR